MPGETMAASCPPCSVELLAVAVMVAPVESVSGEVDAIPARARRPGNQLQKRQAGNVLRKDVGILRFRH